MQQSKSQQEITQNQKSKEKQIEVGAVEALDKIVEQNPELRLCGGSVPYITMRGFQELESEGIRAGFSTRIGGVSDGCFASMNLGFPEGSGADIAEHTEKNYQMFCESLGVDPRYVSRLHQVHGTEVKVVGLEDAGRGFSEDRPRYEVDAQITDQTGLALVALAADCVPMLFADPERHVVGSAHGGWRGSVHRIAEATVQRMSEVYGSDPAEIRVMIGPSAGPEDYEVDETVRQEVLACLPSRVVEDAKILLPSGNVGHWLLNLWELNRQVLLEAGVKEEHIFVTGLSTLKYPEFFHSYRRTGGAAGRCVGMISLVPHA